MLLLMLSSFRALYVSYVGTRYRRRMHTMASHIPCVIYLLLLLLLSEEATAGT
jgi:hypothetical protein